MRKLSPILLGASLLQFPILSMNNAIKHTNLNVELLTAVQKDKISTAKIKSLLDRGASVHARNNRGSSALMLASGKGHIDICRLLLYKGADLHAKNKKGSTPLMWAAYNGHIEICKLLLNCGADIYTHNNKRMTAHLYAVQRGHTETVRLFLEKESEVTLRLADIILFPIILPIKYGIKIWTLWRLVKGEHTGLSLKENFREIALHYAANYGQIETCECLILNGADVNAAWHDGRTSLIGAALNGQAGCCRLLLEKGADLFSKTLDGRTALMYAAQGGHVETCKTLITHSWLFPKRLPSYRLNPLVKTFLTLFMVFKRRELPREIRYLILKSNPELRELLATILIPCISRGKAHLIPQHFEDIVVSTITRNTIEALKPLMANVHSKIQNKEIKALLDTRRFELRFEDEIKQNIYTRLKKQKELE